MATETLSLRAADSDGNSVEIANGDSVQNAYFECLGHAPSGTVDLYWTITALDTGKQTVITADQSDDDFIATVGDNYLTLNILGGFFGTVVCKSQATGESIKVETVTFSKWKSVIYDTLTKINSLSNVLLV